MCKGAARDVSPACPDVGEWERSVPAALSDDALWRVRAYRLALFLSDQAWKDVTALGADGRTLGIASQLYRAVGSISANLAEGYSRGTGRDRARFYEYALGSARESRDWYYKARYLLGAEVTAHRFDILTNVIRLLLAMVPQQRTDLIREDSASYDAGECLPGVD